MKKEVSAKQKIVYNSMSNGLYQIISFEWNEDGFTDCKYIFVMVITLIVAVAGAAFLFEKAELK